MPPSALEKLSRLNISYPMLFEISTENGICKTHCGVLEFIAEEGKVYLPDWMMNTLKIKRGDIIKMENVLLPKGTYIKIQPQSVDFLDISDPRAVLENAMRNFTALTIGDKVAINYNNKTFEIEILETKPESSSGIMVIETDLQVEFAAPVGYEEPVYAKAEKSIASSFGSLMASPSTSRSLYGGAGQKLNGKTVKEGELFVSPQITPNGTPPAPPAAINLPPGKLFFGAKPSPKKPNEPESVVKGFVPFSGRGNSLK